MTDKLNEKISALMDNRLSVREADDLVGRMRHDKLLQHCWARYHLIGDALRNNLPHKVNHDLAAHVSKIIETEAPLPISLETHRHVKTRAVSTAPRAVARTTGVATAFFKPFIGVAVAASVATVAIVSFNMTGGVNSNGQPLVMAPLQNTASMMKSQPVAAPVVVAGRVAANSRLAAYLEDHSRYSSVTMVQGQMLPYVRMVGYAPKE